MPNSTLNGINSDNHSDAGSVSTVGNASETSSISSVYFENNSKESIKISSDSEKNYTIRRDALPDIYNFHSAFFVKKWLYYLVIAALWLIAYTLTTTAVYFEYLIYGGYKSDLSPIETHVISVLCICFAILALAAIYGMYNVRNKYYLPILAAEEAEERRGELDLRNINDELTSKDLIAIENTTKENEQPLLDDALPAEQENSGNPAAPHEKFLTSFIPNSPQLSEKFEKDILRQLTDSSNTNKSWECLREKLEKEIKDQALEVFDSETAEHTLCEKILNELLKSSIDSKVALGEVALPKSLEETLTPDSEWIVTEVTRVFAGPLNDTVIHPKSFFGIDKDSMNAETIWKQFVSEAGQQATESYTKVLRVALYAGVREKALRELNKLVNAKSHEFSAQLMGVKLTPGAVEQCRTQFIQSLREDETMQNLCKLVNNESWEQLMQDFIDLIDFYGRIQQRAKENFDSLWAEENRQNKTAYEENSQVEWATHQDTQRDSSMKQVCAVFANGDTKEENNLYLCFLQKNKTRFNELLEESDRRKRKCRNCFAMGVKGEKLPPAAIACKRRDKVFQSANDAGLEARRTLQGFSEEINLLRIKARCAIQLFDSEYDYDDPVKFMSQFQIKIEELSRQVSKLHMCHDEFISFFQRLRIEHTKMLAMWDDHMNCAIRKIQTDLLKGVAVKETTEELMEFRKKVLCNFHEKSIEDIKQAQHELCEILTRSFEQCNKKLHKIDYLQKEAMQNLEEERVKIEKEVEKIKEEVKKSETWIDKLQTVIEDIREFLEYTDEKIKHVMSSTNYCLLSNEDENKNQIKQLREIQQNALLEVTRVLENSEGVEEIDLGEVQYILHEKHTGNFRSKYEEVLNRCRENDGGEDGKATFFFSSSSSSSDVSDTETKARFSRKKR